MSMDNEDPTPCPLPRYGVGHQVRRSSIFCANGSGTTHGFGLKDAAPRRPRKRQSIGWDPTIDIYEDTVQIQPTQTIQAPPEPRLESNCDRRQTLFAQPVRNVTQEPNHAVNACELNNVRKRRLSSFAAPPQNQSQATSQTISCPQAQRTASAANMAPGSTIRREARRRTIYVPSEDTTILTIHPGGSLREPANPQRPRRSDAFLDVLSEEEGEQPANTSMVQAPLPVVAPVRRMPRQSLAAPARRVPLQQSMRQIQGEAQPSDRPGRGDGQENEPPNALKGVKRLGKRASFIVPEKPAQRPFTGLSTLQEQSPTAPSQPRRQSPNTNVRRVANSSASPGPRAARHQADIASMHVRRTSTLPRFGSSSIRRGSIQVMPAAESRSLRHEAVPTSLSAPRLSLSTAKAHEQYHVITEDIANPSMYEDNWLSQQEQSMTQLVNGLFERTTSTQKMQGSCNNRMSLRQTLLDSYHGDENPLLHKRLQASLQFGALSMPTQTLHQVARFKDDIGQRQRFLDLWTKTYDLDLLQTAAEVVVGRRRASSPRTSDQVGRRCSPNMSRAKALNAFLRTFLVNNDDIARPTSYGEASMLNGIACTNASVAMNWRRTVLRSLMLIHLLDTAVSAGITKGTLFQHTSPYKSSLSVLQGLCRLLVPSVGDISRVLGHLGYHVTHIQYPVEEYEYTIKNLAADLRDGVRLTRLVETLLYPPGSLDIERTTRVERTITMPCGAILDLHSASPSGSTSTKQSWPLSGHLKYPCLSRTQKVYNVQVALAALSNVKDIGNLLQDLKAEDIVDGHREKTVRLLWGLVSRWGLSSLVDFELVEREIRRAAKVWRSRCGDDGATIDPLEADIDAELPYLTGLERHMALLKSWTAHTARLHDVSVTNLSTSFADGRAYKAIVDEYAGCLPACTPQATVPAIGSPASSTRSATASLRASATKPAPHIRSLQFLGCSQSFLHLFASSTSTSTTKSITIPSSKTTIPLLAFLASRLLPLAVPHFAARTIQRTWRRARQRFDLRRRLRCVVLSRACREVVEWRDRIEWAAVVIQRRWRRVCWL